MKFPFLQKSTETAPATSAWPRPASVHGSENTATETAPLPETSDPFLSIRGGESFSSASEISESAVVRGLRSDRLFFEPGETSSILDEAKPAADFLCKRSAALVAVDSRDPLLDFRASMAEMVEAHGLEDWECLEELLACYLRVNRKRNHGYIVGAFADLVLHLARVSPSSNSGGDERRSSSSTATRNSFTSPLSFSSFTDSSISPCSSGA